MAVVTIEARETRSVAGVQVWLLYGFSLTLGLALSLLIASAYRASMTTLQVVTCASAAAVILVAYERYGLAKTLRWFWGFMAGVSAALLMHGVCAQIYGDAGYLIQFVGSAECVHVPWLTAFAAVRGGYPLVGPYSDPVSYLRLTSILVMAITNAVLLWRFPRTSVAFATLTPMWFAFSSGYIEIYPYIAWAFVLYLAVFVESGSRNPWAVGVMGGLMPVLYMGFAPLSAGLAVWFGAGNRNWRDWVKAGSAGAAIWLACVLTCYGPNIPEYVRTFLEKGQSFMGSPLYHPLSYVVSLEHLRELAYTLSFGMGLHWIALFGVAAAAAYPAIRREWRRYVFPCLLLAWHTYYFAAYIQQLGPRLDIDLNWPLYTLIAFLSGHALQRAVDAGRLPDRAVPAAVAFALGANAVIVPALSFSGLPPVP
jgi:hypothetical protein